MLARILPVLGTPLLALPAAAQAYTVTELLPMPGAAAMSGGLGIDEHGWVSGQARPDGLYDRAVVWAGNVRLELTGSGVSGARALAISDGTAVGWSDTLELNAFAWEEGVLTPLETAHFCCSTSHDVNRRGWVVGEAAFGSLSIRHAALWLDGQLMDLGTLGGGSSSAHGVNDAGQVVGSANTVDETGHAFLWEAGVMVDLGTLGGTYSEARDVNESGHVVGWAYEDQNLTKAFLHDGSSMHNLGTLPGGMFCYAHAINDAGQVVGGSYAGSTSGLRGTLWENGAPVDLNSLIPPNTGWVLGEARDINEQGEIVGVGMLGSQVRGYKLTPVGLQRLILAPPVPGIAGLPSDITATWSVPGEPVEVWMSATPFTPRAGAWGLGGPAPDRPVLLGTAITGPDGSATLSVTLPAPLVGERIHLRAVQPAAGKVSGSVRHILQ